METLEYGIKQIGEQSDLHRAQKIELAEKFKNNVPFWFQVYVLIYREYALAFRDPTLYYFQIIMLSGFAFVSGAVFWNLPQDLTTSWNMFPSGLLWIALVYIWVHAFKVYYLR